MDGDITSQIERLADLRARGSITDTEYENLKSKLVAGSGGSSNAVVKPLQVPAWSPPSAPQAHKQKDPVVWGAVVVICIAIIVLVVVLATRKSGAGSDAVGNATTLSSAEANDGLLSEAEYQEARGELARRGMPSVLIDLPKDELASAGKDLCDKARSEGGFARALRSMETEALVDFPQARTNRSYLIQILSAIETAADLMCGSLNDHKLPDPWASRS